MSLTAAPSCALCSDCCLQDRCSSQCWLQDDVPGQANRNFRPGEVSDEVGGPGSALCALLCNPFVIPIGGQDDALALYCGYTTTSPRFEQEPACVPVVAAFVGELLFTVLA